ncbi:hypothetical protein JDN40_01155 [Rhodomicrobium vannielii ATCC 17100]|uniref:hypothetical protein n=1 Tax=Rhodomicrobium vannielii TaxID=1069 RepID=UPI00191A7055|nr:hypothetical protein [Rhodomicrobium vannielii]MBJ7532731.1 hypothetical protein [Rhodomicrobium vannielii ATCC 17100]
MIELDAKHHGVWRAHGGVQIGVRWNRAIRQLAKFINYGHSECCLKLAFEARKVADFGLDESNAFVNHSQFVAKQCGGHYGGQMSESGRWRLTVGLWKLPRPGRSAKVRWLCCRRRAGGDQVLGLNH